MSTAIDTDPEPLVAEAQEALATAWSHPVRLRSEHVIRTWGRHTLLRCRVKHGPPAAPDFVVVKATNQPDGDMCDERSGLELLAAIPAVRGLAPALYGANDRSTLLVIEDIGAGPTLSRLLRAKASWAREAFVESMASLAAVHASTRGRYEEYAAVRAGLGPETAGQPARLQTGFADLRKPLASAYAALGWDEAGVPDDELREVSARMEPPAPLWCLTFYDQCPPNRIMVDGRLRFVDLEMVRFRHPFLDGAYPLIGHYTCMDSLRFPAELELAMLHAYREALSGGYPELTDEGRFGPAMASACAVWMVSMLRTLPDVLARDRVVGFMLVRSRQRLLAILDAFVVASGLFGQLPQLQVACQRIRKQLGARWADTVEPLPFFPIFEPAGMGEGWLGE